MMVPSCKRRLKFFIKGEQIQQPRRKRSFLLDATPLFMELETAGGVMTKLAKRNTTIHARQGQTIADHQPEFPGSARS